MFNDYASKEDLVAMAAELECSQRSREEKMGVFIENMNQFQKDVQEKLRIVCD